MLRFAILSFAAVLSTSNAASAAFTFATFSWDQFNTPNVAVRLGNGAVLGGATFSSGLPSGTVGDVGFPDQPAGSHNLSTFDTSLTTARLTGQATTPNTSRALNLPQGNNGTSTRHGVEFSWTGGRKFYNGGGNEFVVYESASSSSQVENPMVRVRIGGNTWTDWYYAPPTAFQLYVGDASQGTMATAYDLSSLGVPINSIVDAIQIANLTATDRISGTITHSFGGQDFGIGKVVFDNSTTVKPDLGSLATIADRNAGYGSSTLDPDLLYVAVFRTIPEPATLVLAGLALLGFVAVARRRK